MALVDDDYVFGDSALKKLKIGDIVSWSELKESRGSTIITSPEMRRIFGIISKLETTLRGDRKVGIVKVIPMGDLMEKEILAICVSLVSQHKNQDN